MAIDLPPDVPAQAVQNTPTPPAYVVSLAHSETPECRYLTDAESQVALARLRARLPSTSFINAQPSEICGLVRVQMESGTVVYTEPTGRYLLLTFAFDTHKGAPADVSHALEDQIERRQSIQGGLAPFTTPHEGPASASMIPAQPLFPAPEEATKRRLSERAKKHGW